MIPLPPAYTDRMHAMLGSEADAFFEAQEQPYVRGLRVNPLKTPAMPLETLIGGLGPGIPWADDGLYLSIENQAGSHPLHACGAYYIQEPSAMLPARLLSAQPGETVLDLCAAPRREKHAARRADARAGNAGLQRDRILPCGNPQRQSGAHGRA